MGLFRAGLATLLSAILCSAALAQTVTFDGLVTDATRGRDIPYRVYVPQGASGAVPLVLVSHGGSGSPTGFTRLVHLGEHYASEGYLAIHVGHLESTPSGLHRVDRPQDVSHLLDLAEAGSLPLPSAFTGTIDWARIGHVGHSWGAYTAHALAGAEFDHGNFRDVRVKAIAALSPQGPGGFGAFDRGPSDNTWASVDVPVYCIYGALEADFNVTRTLQMSGWRGYPFSRYSNGPDRYLSILAETNHSELGNFGSPETNDFIAINTRLFFDATLRGDRSVACEIGRTVPLSDTTDSRRYDPDTSAAAGCCGPPSETLTFPVVSDATLEESLPAIANSGSTTLGLRVRGNGDAREPTLLFEVRDVQGEITSAVLRLAAVQLGVGDIAVYATTTDDVANLYSWNESPAGLETLDTVQARGAFLEWDVTDLVRGVGAYGFRLEAFGPPGDAHLFASRESGTPPELILQTKSVPTGAAAPQGCDLPSGRAFCFGDGDTDSPGCTPCPCGNDAPPGTRGGCLNAQGRSAMLQAFGEARIGADSLRFELIDGSPTSFALLVSAMNILPANPADPCSEFEAGVFSPVFDGVRCIGGGLIRHGTRVTDASGFVGPGTGDWSGVLTASGFAAGQVRRFQVVYRTDLLGACGSGQNTTQGLEFTLRP